ncbi:GNAT family N-acetyltransferase [Ectobacillus ponti]|uniref:GNAT family N-acetyltransferase n=1 Tax=Ectobacillus ponti TaxID=2961894 RepID=A0AA42BPA9_9BACI|nr:GNAT family protein [Ectobacillus ponti]MCP8968920.1 GNAT family N-acetyltransferase [Ectobacillus ponti]
MPPICLTGQRVKVRTLYEQDLYPLWSFMYGEANPEWKKWDAPYYPLVHQDFHSFGRQLRQRLERDPYSWLVIERNGEIIGSVSYYWEHEASLWLEVGIVIYRPEYWNGGYGTEALRLYTDFLFQALPLGRLGLTTWSGNERMMKVAEKLGMRLEGRLRRCRYYNGRYYDSIRMGMLREEWEQARYEQRLPRKQKG